MSQKLCNVQALQPQLSVRQRSLYQLSLPLNATPLIREKAQHGLGQLHRNAQDQNKALDVVGHLYTIWKATPGKMSTCSGVRQSIATDTKKPLRDKSNRWLNT